MVEFAGYELPVEYSGVTKEHINVRENAGIFDVSHMGEIWVKGKKAKEFLQRVTTNDIDKLEPGKIQYSCFPNHEGGIVDDLLVYYYEKEKYLLVVNGKNTLKDWNWLNENNSEGTDLENASDKISQIAVQGPKATEILQGITKANLSELRNFTFVTGKMGGVEDVIISRTGYTGAGGYELYFFNDSGPDLWKKIMTAGKKYGLMPAGLAARDTLRLEMGFCLYGNDINEYTSPVEAGLGWITKFTNNNNFIAKDILTLQHEEGVERRLVGFELQEKGIPRQHYNAYSLHGEEIGQVTSGTMSPILKKGIGMAYLKKAFSTEGTVFNIRIRNKDIRAQVVKTPFISN